MNEDILKDLIPKKNKILKEHFLNASCKAEEVSVLDTKLLPLFLEAIEKALSAKDTEVQQSHYKKDNHKIGCELESYCNVLFYRGLKKEHDMLLEVASRLK